MGERGGGELRLRNLGERGRCERIKAEESRGKRRGGPWKNRGEHCSSI